MGPPVVTAGHRIAALAGAALALVAAIAGALISLFIAGWATRKGDWLTVALALAACGTFGYLTGSAVNNLRLQRKGTRP